MIGTTLHEIEKSLEELDQETLREMGHPPRPAATPRCQTSLRYPRAEGHDGALDMVRRLVEGHETVIRTARDLVSVAESAGEVATADLATERIGIHEKMAWMLRATASDEGAQKTGVKIATMRLDRDVDPRCGNGPLSSRGGRHGWAGS